MVLTKIVSDVKTAVEASKTKAAVSFQEIVAFSCERDGTTKPRKCVNVIWVTMASESQRQMSTGSQQKE
jgi:hypothetical protein